ncbi:hypothetical protein C0J52_19240 [Blattella germanica]|nr:hypothetical protein C0J52_19240 [Blattella germanica]
MPNKHVHSPDVGLRTRNVEETDITSTNQYTPRPERLRFSYTNVSESDDEELDVLINRRWKVFRVSPLNRFSYTEQRLKQYARRLQEGLATLATGSENAKYDVKFGVESGLTQTRHDKQAVKISVTLVSRTGDDGDGDDEDSGEIPPKLFYLGYLVCRGASRSLEDVSMTHLPLLLCCGTVMSLRNINFLIQKFFDCFISPLELSQDDLIWISAIIAQEEGHTVEFNFKFSQITNS